MHVGLIGGTREELKEGSSSNMHIAEAAGAVVGTIMGLLGAPMDELVRQNVTSGGVCKVMNVRFWMALHSVLWLNGIVMQEGISPLLCVVLSPSLWDRFNR